jgi:hypothetical protein
MTKSRVLGQEGNSSPGIDENKKITPINTMAGPQRETTPVRLVALSTRGFYHMKE